MTHHVSPGMSAEIADEQARREEALVEQVLASFDGAPDERVKELMQALTRHVRHRRHSPRRGAKIEVWEADEDGLYALHYDDGRTPRAPVQRRERQREYRFWCVTRGAPRGREDSRRPRRRRAWTSCDVDIVLAPANTGGALRT